MSEDFKQPAEAPDQEITPQATEEAASEDLVRAGSDVSPEPAARPRQTGTEFPPGVPASRLERLQKILAQAGVASRRHAEELITQGRVQVNGQTVTTLGSKADPAHDHIRVDGKLLQGAERLRYFMLNKPKGYVTTVTDPLGRPTVMGFFAKQGERLYPVGRLDYQSEGLLVVTNDGDLANRLTKPASGVEKTYLVKVSGQPSEVSLDRLRRGIAIEKSKPGSGKVRTAEARIQQVRPGVNPWYEVVLIEGRNRELRKMFEEIGHHVEKIRRVGYGPLVLDVDPGKIRVLNAEEVRALQMTAEGRLRPRRPKAAQMLPKEAGRPAERRPATRSIDRERPSGDSQGRRPPQSRPDNRRGRPAIHRTGSRRDEAESLPQPRARRSPGFVGQNRPAAGDRSDRTRTRGQQVPRDRRSSRSDAGSPDRGRRGERTNFGRPGHAPSGDRSRTVPEGRAKPGGYIKSGTGPKSKPFGLKPRAGHPDRGPRPGGTVGDRRQHRRGSGSGRSGPPPKGRNRH
jgi:23S rRNA pseudouridine2605 synthase